MATKPKSKKRAKRAPGSAPKSITAFRMPDELMADIGRAAKRLNLSRNKLCEIFLQKSVDAFFERDRPSALDILPVAAPAQEASDEQPDLFS